MSEDGGSGISPPDGDTFFGAGFLSRLEDCVEYHKIIPPPWLLDFALHLNRHGRSRVHSQLIVHVTYFWCKFQCLKLKVKLTYMYPPFTHA